MTDGGTNSGIAPLATDRLDLVPTDPERDAVSLHPMWSDPEVFRLDTSATPTRSLEETQHRLEQELATNGGWTWSIRLRASGDSAGTVGLFPGPPTPIRGVGWRLRRDHWGQGLMTEAATAATEHLLAQPLIEGLEAWIDSQNTRSLGVARRARFDERSRLPLTYPDRTAQTIVMARAARPSDLAVLAVRPTLSVRDVAGTSDLLCKVLGLHTLFLYGDPPGFGRLGVGPWAESPGLELGTADDEIVPARVSVDIGQPTDIVYKRATRAGLEVDGQPEDKPWHRREFTFMLPEGHRIRVIGPLNPSG